jgi:hypothetical protein
VSTPCLKLRGDHGARGRTATPQTRTVEPFFPTATTAHVPWGLEVPGSNPGNPTKESRSDGAFCFQLGNAIGSVATRWQWTIAAAAPSAPRGVGDEGRGSDRGRGRRRRLNGSADAWIRPRRFAVRTRKYEQVAVRITQPELAMGRSARPVGGIAMRR